MGQFSEYEMEKRDNTVGGRKSLKIIVRVLLLPTILGSIWFGYTGMGESMFKADSHSKDIMLQDPSTISHSGSSTTSPYSAGHRNTCQSVKNVYYLKVPKTGSGTMTILLYRYALAQNLSVATLSTFGLNIDLMRVLVPPYEKKRKYNLMTLHTPFDEKAIKNILENDDLRFIATIREPLARFSSAMYFNLKKPQILGLGRTEEEPVMEFLKSLKPMTREKAKRYTAVRNVQANWFKIPKELNPSSDLFKTYMERIDQNFLVLIREYNSESLAFMRRRLCWNNHKYIILMAVHKTKHPDYQSAKRAKFCEWSSQDCYLYAHLNQSFWKNIKAIGPDLIKEAEHIETLNHKVLSFCQPIVKEIINKGWRAVINRNITFGKLVIEPNEWSVGFSVTPWDCAVMNVQPRSYNKIMYTLQNPGDCRGRNSSKLCIPGVTEKEIMEHIMNLPSSYLKG